MPLKNDSEDSWGSRRKYLMALICQIMGSPVLIGVANSAVRNGATGQIIAYVTATLLLGIPLMYMEFIVSQFTARDCVDTWKIRPCFSHIGYILVFWQTIHIIYNHTISSFVLHYLLISFENPVPYYTCGQWANKSCNILLKNHTVNEDCIKLKQPAAYCEMLHNTFPESQYWKLNIMGDNIHGTYHVAWRVSLASSLICVIMYLSCFKRKQSVKFVVEAFVLTPILGYTVLLLGTMSQKGIVVKYDNALDSDFSLFFEDFRLSRSMFHVVCALGIGSGATFNLASSSSFRAPCYSNTVVAVVVSAAVAALIISVTAMMACPYAYEQGIDPEIILKAPISFLFEKTPRFVSVFQHRYFYLIMIFTCLTMLGIGSNLIYILQLLEVFVIRNPRVAKYPGLACFFGILAIYIISLPLFGYIGVDVLLGLRRASNFVAIFIAIIETIVFVIWYGLEKFSEDVHFMQGLQPNKYMRLSWLVSSIVLTYIFVSELRVELAILEDSIGNQLKRYMIITSIGLIVVVFTLKLLIAACKKQFHEVFKLDPAWGPRSELLQRSRAMFSAQAMTKEYLYRQYHLQAGILARQRISNCRTAERDV